MNNIKISIILPIYNASYYLRQCLDSIVNQTLADIEIICVNDGSTDNSLDIINEYAKNDNRIVVINKKNSGLGAAYNSGLEIAKGEYIGFVEPDDYISPNMYEELYNCTQTKPDIVRADWFLVREKYITEQNKYSSYEEGIYKNYELNKFLEGNLGHWSCIYKNDYFIKKYNIRFTPSPGAAFQDIGFTIITNLLAENIYLKPNQYYYYRIHEKQSICSTEHKKVLKNWITEFNFVLNYFTNNDLAKNSIDLQLLNYYTYRLLRRKGKTLNYLNKVSKILNSEIFVLGYYSGHFPKLTDCIYKLTKKNPLLSHIFTKIMELNIFLKCYS